MCPTSIIIHIKLKISDMLLGLTLFVFVARNTYQLPIGNKEYFYRQYEQLQPKS